MRCPDKGSERRDAEEKKLSGLVKRRQNAKFQCGAFFVPQSVVVAGDHVRAKAPWRQAGIESLPSRPGILPLVIDAVEPVSKQHTLRNGKAQGGIIDLNRLVAWGKSKAI